MFNRKICTRCKTGKESLMLDQRSPVCPYMEAMQDRKCTHYEKYKSLTMYKRILEKLKKK